MTTAAKVNLEFYQGDHYKLIIPLTDPDENPIDLTGMTFLAAVREEPEDEQGWNLTITDDGLGGTLTLELTQAQTREMPETAFWDLEWSNFYGTDKPVTIIAGTVKIYRDVARA